MGILTSYQYLHQLYSHGKQTCSPESNCPPTSRRAIANLRSWTGCSVAGDGFCSLLVRLGGGAVTIGMTVSIAIRRSDGDRLPRVREISRHRLGDVADRSDLHDCRLGLLQHQFLVDRANLGLLFVSLLAASALLFGRGHGNVVLQVANTRCIFSVNLQGMLKALQVDGLALGIDFMLPVVLVPLGHGCVLVHVLDDLPPAHAEWYKNHGKHEIY